LLGSSLLVKYIHIFFNRLAIISFYSSTANRPIAPGFESVAIQTDPDLLEIENPDTPETDNEDTSLKVFVIYSYILKYDNYFSS